MWTFVGKCSIIYLTGVVVAVMVCVCVGGVFVCVYFVCVCVCVYSKLSQNALGQTVPRQSHDVGERQGRVLGWICLLNMRF